MAKKISAKVIIEVLGAPKAHVEETIKLIVEKAKEYKNIKVNNDEVFDATQIKDKPFFTTFAELNVETEDVENLMGFCFDFMPSSVEILEPDRFDMDAVKINNLLNDLLARLHQYDAVLKNMNAQNIVLKREMDKLKGNKKE